jgi:hypothetical protein
MKRLLARASTILLSAALGVAATTGAAEAGTITLLRGCYGVEGTIVCDPTLTYGIPAGAETYQDTLHVCAGTCTDVPVTLVRTTSGDPLLVCVTYKNEAGTVTSRCADPTVVDPYVDLIVELVENAGPIVENVIQNATTRVCQVLDNFDIYCA